MHNCLLFVHALAPLHAGTGQGVGVIDLPIARETGTRLPYLPGSSLKGSLRDRCVDKKLRESIFGPDQNHAHEHAGAAVFSDQRLLLLPIRSLYGIFAWTTCPFVLRRLVRDVKDAGSGDIPSLPGTPLSTPNATPPTVEALVAPSSPLIGQFPTEKGQRSLVCLEDLDLSPKEDQSVKALARWMGARVFPNDKEWAEMLEQRLCVLPDDVFSFLLETATEVTARIRLQPESKTVENGALWYEEALPSESVLYGVMAVLANKKTKATPKEISAELTRLCETPVQLGGKATVGRGVCRLRLNGGV